MKCFEEGCNTDFESSSENTYTVQVGCSSYATAYRCPGCGRLHWENGLGVFNRSGNKAFVDDDGGEYVVDKETGARSYLAR